MAKTQLEDVAERLKNARINRKLTQMDVYRLAQIHNKTLSGYETAKNEPDLVTLSRLSDLYQVSMDWIVTGFEFHSKSRLSEEEAKVKRLQEKLNEQTKIIKGIRELVKE